MKNETKILLAKIRNDLRPVFASGLNMLIKEFGEKTWFDEMINDYNNEVVLKKGIIAPLTYCQNWTIKNDSRIRSGEFTNLETTNNNDSIEPVIEETKESLEPELEELLNPISNEITEEVIEPTISDEVENVDLSESAKENLINKDIVKEEIAYRGKYNNYRNQYDKHHKH